MGKYNLKLSKTEKVLYTTFTIVSIIIITFLIFMMLKSSDISLIFIIMILIFFILFFVVNQIIFFMNKLTYYEIQDDKIVWRLLFMKAEIPFSKFDKVDLANFIIHARIFNKGISSKYTIQDILKASQDFNENLKNAGYGKASKPVYDLIEKDTVYKKKMDNIIRLIFLVDGNDIRIRPTNPGLFLKELSEKYKKFKGKELKINVIDVQA